MPSIRQRLAGFLLGPEVQAIREAFVIMREGYVRGPYSYQPRDLARDLMELDSHTLTNLIREVGYLQLGVGEPNEADRRRAVFESRYLVRSSPLAEYAMWLWTAYGHGQNVDVVADDETAAEVWNEFWAADRNAMVLGARYLQDLSNNVLHDGERFLAMYASKATGKCTIRSLNSLEFVDRIMAPGDATTTVWWHRQWSEVDPGHPYGQLHDAYYPDYLAFLSGGPRAGGEAPLGNTRGNDPNWLGWDLDGKKIEARDLLPQGAIRADEASSMTFVCVVCVAHKADENGRGWPLMTTGHGWVKEHEQFRVNRANVAEARSMFVNELKTKSGSRGVDAVQAQIASTLQRAGSTGDWEQNPPPVSGSTYLGNEAQSLRQLNLDTGASDAKADGESLAWYALLSARIFPHYAGIGDAYRLACYDNQTEVLTEDGWCAWHQWVPGQRIASYSAGDGVLTYREPSALHVYAYAGPMVRLCGAQVDALVTPNHRMLVSDETHENRQHVRPFTVVRADALPVAFGLPSMARITSHERLEQFYLGNEPVERPLDADAWLTFLGWWIAEGSLEDRHVVSLCQRMNATAEVAAIDACLERLPFAFSRKPMKGAYWRWRCSDASLHAWLRDNVGHYQWNRRLPAFVFALPHEQATLLLDAYMAGDGHERMDGHPVTQVGGFDSTSRLLLDDVQRLMLHHGEWGKLTQIRSAGPHHGDAASRWMQRDGWRLYRNRRERLHLRRHINVTVEEYRGLVWCFEVPPDGMFVTRRHGAPLIAGNTATAMERPIQLSFGAYQSFWASVWRDVARIVFDMANRYGKDRIDAKNVTVNLDKLLETDTAAQVQNIVNVTAQVVLPLMQAAMLPDASIPPIIASIVQASLQAVGVQDVEDVISADMVVQALDAAKQQAEENRRLAQQIAKGEAPGQDGEERQASAQTDEVPPQEPDADKEPPARSVEEARVGLAELGHLSPEELSAMLAAASRVLMRG